VPLEEGWLDKESIKEPLAIAEAFKRALKAAQPHVLAAEGAFCCLPENAVFRKIIDMEILPDADEMREAVRFQSAEYLPVALDEMEVDYQPLPVLAKEPSQVAVVAASRTLIDGYLAVFAAAKVPLRVIEPAAASIGRAVTPLHKPQGVVLVDIGANLTTVAAYADLIVQLSSTVTVGAESVTAGEEEKLSTTDQAERIEGLGAALADEIDRVTRFYQSRAAGRPKLTHIVLTGQGSELPKIAQILTKQVELPVRAGTASISLPPECGHGFFAPLGAALYPLQERL
jgi:Tfp pilus assembly PilM family ATPase